jgi:hypothetical protein
MDTAEFDPAILDIEAEPPLGASPFTRTTERFAILQSLDIRLESNTFEPYASHFAHKMSELLPWLYPEATEPMLIASQALHLHPHLETAGALPVYMTPSGEQLRAHDADTAYAICVDCGYTEWFAERVAQLVRRDDIATDFEARMLQDVEYLARVCDAYRTLIDHHVEPEETLLRTALKKMTPLGREALIQLPMLEKDGIPITHL